MINHRSGTTKRISSRRVDAGGSAAQRGIEYQNRVASWLAVLILAEEDMHPPFDLPAEAIVNYIACETNHPIDDLLVRTSLGDQVFIQAKRRLKLERGASSEFGAVVHQMVEQFSAAQGRPGEPTLDHLLDTDRNRFVIAIGPASSSAIAEGLRSILDRARLLTSDQPLSDCAINAKEKAALDVVLRHIDRSYRELFAAEPDNNTKLQIMRFIHVFVVDVENGGSAEREAKNLLRSSVLLNPSQADSAWDALMRETGRYASLRAGGDRTALQQTLLSRGIAVKSARSYRPDIDRLAALTTTGLQELSDFSRILVGDAEIRITRASTTALKSAVENTSIVVVGDPGAGKSGALHDLAQALREENRDVVLLTVGRWEAASVSSLGYEMRLEHDIHDVLEHWPGAKKGFLIIDALDAGRSEASENTFREIISLVLTSNSRWRIVVSIRKFDLRYSSELSRLFRGRPPTPYHDPEFAIVCHLNVPTLSDDELVEIARQSSALASLVAQATPDLLKLLRVPFNMRLLAELLGLNIPVQTLTPIGSQIELLDRYWTERVIGSDRKGDARESVILKAVQRMVENRSLRLARTIVSSDPAANDALREVLSAHLLIEWQPDPTLPPERYVLSFSHHILFDYAVARLLLRGTPESFIARLRSDPACVLAIRPSLVMHYQELWHRSPSRQQFWDLVLQAAASEGLPEILKLIGPYLASELFAKIEDVSQLLQQLNQNESVTRDGAERAFRHLIGAAVSNTNNALIGPDAPPWCEMAERSSLSMRPATAYPLRTLISVVCDEPDRFTVTQRLSAGVTARRLLDFAMQQDANRWLLRIALLCVCRTFESNLIESATLLRRVIEPQYIREHGYELLSWLAREVERLARFDSALVVDIYEAAFAHRDESDTPSPLDESSLIHLVSNRRQDYNSGLYALADAYGRFLSAAPADAIRALTSALEDYIRKEHQVRDDEPTEQAFQFRHWPVTIRTDYSSVWDEGDVYNTDEPIKMLDTFGYYLNGLAQSGSEVHRAEILDALAKTNRLAVVWRRLLVCGRSYPHTLGRDIRSLGWAVPILTCEDTTIEAGRYLVAVFELLDEVEREQIERAILSIPRSAEERMRTIEEETRDRLLGCLPRAVVVTDDARQALRDIDSRGGPPPNKPGWSFEFGSREYSERDYLREKDVPIDAEPNRRIQELEEPVKAFSSAHFNSPPDAKQTEQVLPCIRKLRQAISTSVADGVHPEQMRLGFLTLAEACRRIAGSESISCEEESGSLTTEILLDAAHDTEPQPSPDMDEAFDRHQSWSPAPRIEAAAGLVMIGRHPSCASETVLKAIELLSRDNVAAVRFQVAQRLNSLYYTAPELMWSIIEGIAADEESRGVLQALLTGPLHPLSNAQPNRVAGFAQMVLSRISDGDGAKEVRSLCIRILTGLFVWRGDERCRDPLEAFLASPGQFPDEAGAIVGSLRDAVRHGEPNGQNAAKDAVRHRAFSLLTRILSSIEMALKEFVNDPNAMDSTTTSSETGDSEAQTNARSRVQRLVSLAEGISYEVYFGSGAYDDQAGAPPGEPIPQAVKRRFLAESHEVLDELASIAELGIPRVAHQLLQTLDYLTDVAPRDAFLQIARVVRGVRASGYQHEQLAEELILVLVTRFLADYRNLLQCDEDCRVALIDILGIFVEAGWPRARQLAYELDIFR